MNKSISAGVTCPCKLPSAKAVLNWPGANQFYTIQVGSNGPFYAPLELSITQAQAVANALQQYEQAQMKRVTFTVGGGR